MILEDISLDNAKFALKLTRICDECGKKEKAKAGCIKQGRKIRNGNIDLCWKCSQLKKYRKLPHGEKYAKWKHGITVTGYRRVFDEERGERVLEHKFVMEKFLGRKINKNEHIHHINLNKLDCSINNLHVCNGMSGHRLIHSSLQKCGYLLFKSNRIFFDDKTNQYTMKETEFTSKIVLSEQDENRLKSIKSYISILRGRPIEVCALRYKKDNQWKQRTKTKHILIGEAFLNRRFYKNECIHHLDGDSTNNNLNNLIIMENGEHQLTHSSLEKVTASCLEMGIVVFDKKIGEYKCCINESKGQTNKKSKNNESDSGNSGSKEDLDFLEED